MYRCDSEKDSLFLDNFYWLVIFSRYVDKNTIDYLSNYTNTAARTYDSSEISQMSGVIDDYNEVFSFENFFFVIFVICQF